MKILVVDDERDAALLFRQHFRKELRQGDVELVFAFSGEEALAWLAREAHDGPVMVLSDVNMPGMTGLELLCRIKRAWPEVPVCIMTAYGVEAYREQATRCNGDGFFMKPLAFDALKQHIKAFAAQAG